MAASNGYEYYAAGVGIADQKNSNEVAKTIVAGTSVKASVTFDLVTDVVRSISKIQIRCHSGGSGYYDIDFRNVTVR